MSGRTDKRVDWEIETLHKTRALKTFDFTLQSHVQWQLINTP